jgi:hypothetical protein
MDRAALAISMLLLQHLDLHVAVVNRSLGFAVQALEADGAGAGEVFEGFLKFVGGTVGVFADFGPLVEIGLDDFDAVEDHRDHGTFAGDGVVVPLADGLGRALAGGHGVVDGGDHAVLAAVRRFVDLDFEGGEGVFDIAGAEEDTAVGFFFDLELEVEDEVAVGILGPEGVMVLGDEDAVFELPFAGGDGVGEVGGEEVLPAGGVGVVGGQGEGGGGEKGEEGEFHGETGNAGTKRKIRDFRAAFKNFAPCPDGGVAAL